MMQLAAEFPQQNWTGASIACESCGWKNVLPPDPSHMIIVGKPWRIKLVCSNCGVAQSLPLDKVARPFASPPKEA